MESMQLEDHTDMQIDQLGGVKSPGGLRRFFDLERRKAFKPIVFEQEVDFKKRPLSADEQPRERHRRRAEKYDIAFVEPKKKFLTRAELRTLIARRRAGDRRGFITGLDPFSEEEQAKKERRAERFAASLAIQDVSMHDRVDSYTMESAWPSSERFGMSQGLQAATAGVALDVLEERKDVRPGVKLRREAIHVYGTDHMSTKDVMTYMKDFGPSFVEWINDSSCNIVFEDMYSAKRALIGLGIPEETMSEPIAGQEPLARWYVGRPFSKGTLQIPLAMRIACADDVKPAKGVISRHLWEARPQTRLPATRRRGVLAPTAVRRRRLLPDEPQAEYEPSRNRLAAPQATSGESVGDGVAGVTRDQHKRKQTRAADARHENVSARRRPRPRGFARPRKLQNSLYSIDINHIQNLTVNITNSGAMDQNTRNGKRKSSGRRPGADLGGEQAPTIVMGGAGSGPMNVRDLRDWLNRGLFPEHTDSDCDERDMDGYDEGSYGGEYQEEDSTGERAQSEERKDEGEDGTDVDVNDRWEDAEGGEVESGYVFDDRYVASDSGWEDEYLKEGTGEKSLSKETMESTVKRDVKGTKQLADVKDAREEREALQEKPRRRERKEHEEWENKVVRDRRDTRDGNGGKDIRDVREKRDGKDMREARDGRDVKHEGGARNEKERKDRREERERREAREVREKRERERERERGRRELREGREKREREREWRDAREAKERLRKDEGDRRREAHKGEDRDSRRMADEREARKRVKEKRRE